MNLNKRWDNSGRKQIHFLQIKKSDIIFNLESLFISSRGLAMKTMRLRTSISSTRLNIWIYNISFVYRQIAYRATNDELTFKDIFITMNWSRSDSWPCTLHVIFYLIILTNHMAFTFNQFLHKKFVQAPIFINNMVLISNMKRLTVKLVENWWQFFQIIKLQC